MIIGPIPIKETTWYVYLTDELLLKYSAEQIFSVERYRIPSEYLVYFQEGGYKETYWPIEGLRLYALYHPIEDVC